MVVGKRPRFGMESRAVAVHKPVFPILHKDMDKLSFYSYKSGTIRNLDAAEDSRGATPNVDPFGYLERGGPPGGARRAIGLGARQKGRARSHHLQQIETDHGGRPPALALDGVGGEVARRDQHHGRHLRVPLYPPPAGAPPTPPPTPAASP